MEWLQLILSAIGGSVVSLVSSILYFRPKLKEANANAVKTQAEAQNYVLDSLVSRMNQMEKMYNEQLESQNKVISELRAEVLNLTKEKFESDKRILVLEDENKQLRAEIEQLKLVRVGS